MAMAMATIEGEKISVTSVGWSVGRSVDCVNPFPPSGSDGFRIIPIRRTRTEQNVPQRRRERRRRRHGHNVLHLMWCFRNRKERKGLSLFPVATDNSPSVCLIPTPSKFLFYSIHSLSFPTRLPNTKKSGVYSACVCVCVILDFQHTTTTTTLYLSSERE